MHDFCFTIPYGLILVCGGVMGYASKGSTASLAGGVGTGFVLILAGYLSLQAFHKRKNSYFALILETACAAVLTWVMGQRYMQTSKIMPAGVVAGISYVAQTLQNVAATVSDPRKIHFFLKIRHKSAGVFEESKQHNLLSALMTGFYLYKIATGGNHFPLKTE